MVPVAMAAKADEEARRSGTATAAAAIKGRVRFTPAMGFPLSPVFPPIQQIQ
jgi:hypothetical protein